MRSGRAMRHLFDVHPAFGRDHEGDARRRAIDQGGEIELLGDFGPFLDVEPADLAARRSGLDRHQGGAEHLPGEAFDIRDRAGQAHAAHLAGAGFLELALAAPAGMDLRLDDPQGSAELVRCLAGL